MDIQEAKSRLPLRELARTMGFNPPEKDGSPVSCWFPERHANEDRKPSFNLFRDRFNCFGCGAQGDGIDLLAELLGLDRVEAVREYKRRAGGIDAFPIVEVNRPKRKERKPWPELRPGTVEELETLARLRGLDVHGLALAEGMGVLRFGHVCGRDCWLVTDSTGRLAEARRMDGDPFSEFKNLPERKPHCLPGSSKGWPVGLLPDHSNPALFRRLLLVEGQPDLMAAYHFAERFGALTWLPVAMLGRSCRILPEALEHVAGRHVRIVPHRDEDAGGTEAAKGWAKQLRDAGATVDFFILPDGLRRRDGRPAKDLCDFANLPERDAARITELFKMPDSIEGEAPAERLPLPSSLPSVVHCKKAPFDVYIGRPSKWGNPFEIPQDGNRETVIRKFREWLPKQPELMAALPELKGKTLGCWCAPQACHGEILLELANGVSNSSPTETSLFEL